MSAVSLHAAATLRNKEAYENMDALWLALHNDPGAQVVLLGLWRRQVWGMATVDGLHWVQRLVPELWRDLVACTVPNVVVLNRWEADHGFTNRS